MVDARGATRYSCRSDPELRARGLEKVLRDRLKSRNSAGSREETRRAAFHVARSQTTDRYGLPGWNLHSLQGQLAGHWSVKVNANWRLTFRFEDEDAILVDYQDYH